MEFSLNLNKHKINIILFALFNVFFMYSQDYEKAYFISNSGDKIDGMINNNFDLNSDFFYFKKDTAKQDSKILISDVSELNIGDSERFISRRVDYHENSIVSDSELIYSKEDDSKNINKRQVLLKVLVEGSINLYKGFINDRALYYIKDSSSENLEYLIFYKYLSDDGVVRSRPTFRRQLYKVANCNNENVDKFQLISYYESDLVKLINRHNICKTGQTLDYSKIENNKRRIKFAPFFGAKLNRGIFNSENYFEKGQIKDTHLSPNIGVEISTLLPSRKKKSEIFLRLDFSMMNFNTSESYTVSSGVSLIENEVIYKATILELSLGYRYFLKSYQSKNNIAFDLSVNSASSLGKDVVFNYKSSNGVNESFNLNESVNNAFGITFGSSYIYQKRYALELRYTFYSDFLESTLISTKFSNLNLNFKYLFL